MARTILRLALTVLSFAAIIGIATAQTTSTATLARGEMDALRGRLEVLERQNAEFQEQLRLLRRELDNRTQRASPSAPAGAPEGPSPEARLEAVGRELPGLAGARRDSVVFCSVCAAAISGEQQQNYER